MESKGLLALMFIGLCIIVIVEEWNTNLISLAILFHFLCAQHVSEINISIIRSLRLCCWITTSVVLFSVRCVLEIWCGWFWVVLVLQAEAQLCFWTRNLVRFWRGTELLLRIIIIIIINVNIIVITSLHFIRHKIEQEAEDNRVCMETSHCDAQRNNKDNVSQHTCLLRGFKKKPDYEPSGSKLVAFYKDKY